MIMNSDVLKIGHHFKIMITHYIFIILLTNSASYSIFLLLYELLMNYYI